MDGFDGDVNVELGAAFPFEFAKSIVVEAGHVEAQGTIFLPKAWPTTQPMPPMPRGLTARASAMVDGKSVSKPLAEVAKLSIGGDAPTTVELAPIDAKADAIVIRPGERAAAWLRVKRGPLKGPMTFEVENLPHGVIVADIGLSGVMIPDGQEERQIFLQCAPWVSPQVRACHARALQGDGPTSGVGDVAGGAVSGGRFLFRLQRSGTCYNRSHDAFPRLVQACGHSAGCDWFCTSSQAHAGRGGRGDADGRVGGDSAFFERRDEQGGDHQHARAQRLPRTG